MKKIFLAIALTLSFTIFSHAQAKSNDAINSQIKSLNVQKMVKLEYDGDSTKMIGLGADFGDQDGKNGFSSFTFGMAFNYNGRSLPYSVPAFVMTFWAKPKGGQKFANSHALKFVVDGEEIDMGDARYTYKNGMEYMNFMMNRDQLSKLANATEIAIKIGSAEFSALDSHKKLFSSLYTVSDINNQ